MAISGPTGTFVLLASQWHPTTLMISVTHRVESGGANEDRLLVERHGKRTVAIICDGAGNGGCRHQYSLSFISALMSRDGNNQLQTRHPGGEKLNFSSLWGFRTRGWRHPLLIKRMLATITPEI